MAKLSSIAYYVTDKISSNDISLAEYVTTDCILQNKKGREIAANLPPQPCSLIRYQRGDVLIANIRPYLKKVWFADIDGGASPDVLVLRSKDGHLPNFLYAILLQDSFFDYVMQGTKGSKMPRGDKEQILRYEVPIFSCSEENIGTFFLNLDCKIRLNEQINQNLEAMAKQLYDYWFVQFDFPDENGRPYKSSGGEMLWNEKLKRFIPRGWESSTLGNECQMYQPKTLGLSELDEFAKYKVYGANGIIGKYHAYNHENSEIAMACRGNSCGTVNRTAPFSWITGNAMVIKMIDDSIHNEYIKQALRYANVEGAISGSGQPQLTRENLNSIKLCKPTRELIIRFSEQVSNIVEMYLQNESNIEELTKQRDELLPLLMNGQVSVNSDLSDD